MNALNELVFPGVALFFASLVLTSFSLWLAGRLTPWFLQEAIEPPTLRSYFLEPSADMDLNRVRFVTIGIASAIMLAVLLALAITVRFGG
jgi:hypothetical protein